MPIPREILDVPRPVNTVVAVYGKNKDRYAVKQRVGCKRVDGRNLPVTGPTIGHIIDGEYVPIPSASSVAAAGFDLLDWAVIEYAARFMEPLIPELLQHYNREDTEKISCIALLRVCYPGIKDYELKSAYEESFLSVRYPGIALSKNTVCAFLGNLGKAYSRIVSFMRYRAASVEQGHHLIVNGTLKSNESKVNSLSNFSREAKVKGFRDISVIYAYDLEIQEPVCSECFPGNMLDMTAYHRFIRDNGIQTGIIVADKGFPESAAGEAFEQNPNLHYLNPIKRNSKYISTYDLHDYDRQLIGQGGLILCKKVQVKGKQKWLYSFRDAAKAAKEEQDWLRRTKAFDEEKRKEKLPAFGTIVLESDLDLTPETAYKAYSGRWEIELVMRYYKSALDFDETRVHDDYSVIGSEFIDFLSSVITMRIIRDLDRADLLTKMPYKKIMTILRRAKKLRLSSNDNWKLVKLNPSQEEVLRALNLLSPLDKPAPRKRGRPRKSQP